MLEEKDTTAYKAESVGRIMSTNIPVCLPDTPHHELIHTLLSETWDTAHDIYVVDKDQRLLGVIDVAKNKGTRDITAKELMHPVKVYLSTNDDQEKVVFSAIKQNVIAIPVLSASGKLLGVVTAHTIIDIMHAEHIEDSLLAAGVRREGGDLLQRVSDGIGLSVKSRAPWLIIGTVAGLGLSLLTSQFEESLQNSIAIAYFIPVVAYVAGSIGAQSSAIAVRSLAVMKVNYVSYLARELMTGFCLGAIVGVLGLLGALIISQSLIVAAAVALALFLTGILSTFLAALIPFLLVFAKKDPATGSGPLATACLDIISITLYFFITTAII